MTKMEETFTSVAILVAIILAFINNRPLGKNMPLNTHKKIYDTYIISTLVWKLNVKL